MNKSRFTSTRKVTGAALSLLMAAGGPACSQAQPTANNRSTVIAANQDTEQTKFCCKMKALDGEERARHHKLTERLIANRNASVETGKGYEFQFSPVTISLADLAEWAAAEAKCCPFFDFHLDLEREGTLLCLRLTGEQGIKEFIRAEFQVLAK